MSILSHPYLRWLLAAVLVGFSLWMRLGRIENRRASASHVKQSRTTLYWIDSLAPEDALYLMQRQIPPQDGLFIRMDWPELSTLIQQRHPKAPPLASPVIDAWGMPYFGVFDFNRDGVVPDPEVQANPALRIERHPFLARPSAVFSAGPDGDPATWQDNIKNW